MVNRRVDHNNFFTIILKYPVETVTTSQFDLALAASMDQRTSMNCTWA